MLTCEWCRFSVEHQVRESGELERHLLAGGTAVTRLSRHPAIPAQYRVRRWWFILFPNLPEPPRFPSHVMYGHWSNAVLGGAFRLTLRTRSADLPVIELRNVHSNKATLLAIKRELRFFEEGATPTAYSDIRGEAAFTSGRIDRSQFFLPMARTVPVLLASVE